MPYSNPDDARRYQRQYRSRRRAADSGCTAKVVNVETRLRTIGDVLAVIEEATGRVRGDSGLASTEQARVVGYLGSVALKAIELGGLVARIEELERVLKVRSCAR